MRTLPLAVLFAALLWFPVAAEVLKGSAAALDGRTIAIAGMQIRLLDIDAPDRNQPCRDTAGVEYRCGERAEAALAEILDGGPLACDWAQRDLQGRKLARCTLGETDVGRRMVELGWAVPDRDCKCETYREAATRAEAAHRGLWQGEFEMPWDWRADAP